MRYVMKFQQMWQEWLRQQYPIVKFKCLVLNSCHFPHPPLLSGIPFEAGHANRVKLANTQMTEQILVWIVFRGGLAGAELQKVYFLSFSQKKQKRTQTWRNGKSKKITLMREVFFQPCRFEEKNGQGIKVFLWRVYSIHCIRTTYNQMEHMCIVGGYWGIILLTGE